MINKKLLIILSSMSLIMACSFCAFAEKSDDIARTETGFSSTTAWDVSEVAENIMPAIVSITSRSYIEDKLDEWIDTNYTFNIPQVDDSTGIIVAQDDDKIYIIANKNVVKAAENNYVKFYNDNRYYDNEYVADVIETSETLNLALLEVQKKHIPEDIYNNLKIATLGKSSDLKIGEPAICVGNALDLKQIITTGVISAIDNDKIYTDASVGAFSRGGALLNKDGEVVGIIDDITLANYAENIGYATPIDKAIPIMEGFLKKTSADSWKDGYLGVVVVTTSDEVQELYDIPQGTFVYDVQEDSAAEKAGIKKGDIIVEIDGKPVNSTEELVEILGYHQENEEINIKIKRMENGEYKEKEVKATLQAKKL